MSQSAVDFLPDLLSLDITAGLVAQGLRASWRGPVNEGDAPTTTIAITNATNATPIVLTLATPITEGDLRAPDAARGYAGRVFHVVVAGVAGNTAANKLSAEDQRNEAWVGIALTSTTLALYEIDNSTGGLTASVGNGAYTSGGTISKALVDGRVMVGREHVDEESAAPRIIFVPSRIGDGPADARSMWTAEAITDLEPQRQRLAQTFRSKTIWYEVHIWGASPPNTPEWSKRAFGVCEKMYDQILRSAQERGATCYEVGDHEFIDQQPDAPQRVKFGHELVGRIGFAAPIVRDEALLSSADMTLDTVFQLLIGDVPEEI